MTTKEPGQRQWDQNTERLSAIIRPIAQRLYSTDVEWRNLDHRLAKYGEDWGGMDLNPDFQRGHVWTKCQQQRFIEAALRGTLSTSAFNIQFNCPNWENDHYEGDLPRGFQCIDGLQRITAVSKFVRGEILPFGLHIRDLDISRFQIKTHYNFHFQVFAYEKRSEVIQHYLDFNDGGTQHPLDEIERVRNLLAESNESELQEAIYQPQQEG